MRTTDRFVGKPLGMGAGAGRVSDTLAGGFGVPEPKMWIASAIGAGVGLASSLFGGMAASEAQKAAERRQKQAESKEAAWHKRKYNEDFVDTAEGQNLVRRAKDFARENWKKAQGAAAVGGGTNAATAMAKEAGNKMVSDTIANMAAQDTKRKSQVDDQHRQAEMQFAQMDMDRANQKAANIQQAAGAASNAIMSVAGAVDQATASHTSLQGGGNNAVDKSIKQDLTNQEVSHTDSTVNVGTLDTGGMTDEDILREKNRMVGV